MIKLISEILKLSIITFVDSIIYIMAATLKLYQKLFGPMESAQEDKKEISEEETSSSNDEEMESEEAKAVEPTIESVAKEEIVSKSIAVENSFSSSFNVFKELFEKQKIINGKFESIREAIKQEMDIVMKIKNKKSLENPDPTFTLFMRYNFATYKNYLASIVLKALTNSLDADAPLDEAFLSNIGSFVSYYTQFEQELYKLKKELHAFIDITVDDKDNLIELSNEIDSIIFLKEDNLYTRKKFLTELDVLLEKLTEKRDNFGKMFFGRNKNFEFVKAYKGALMDVDSLFRNAYLLPLEINDFSLLRMKFKEHQLKISRLYQIDLNDVRKELEGRTKPIDNQPTKVASILDDLPQTTRLQVEAALKINIDTEILES